jgi:hypothetical protein
MSVVSLIAAPGAGVGALGTGLVSIAVALEEGPPPGTVNHAFVVTFSGPKFAAAPHVLISTGNPHWTGHAIWVTEESAGIVVNQKNSSPGGRAFDVYVLAMGPLAADPSGASDRPLGAEARAVTVEDILSHVRPRDPTL